MAHPFTQPRRSFIIYLAIWLFLALVSGFILMLGQDFPVVNSFTETALSSILFGVFGLFVWYPTRYIPFQKQAPVYSALAHVVVAVLVITLWVLLHTVILGVVFPKDVLYQEYLENSIIMRVIVGVFAYLVLILVYYLVINSRRLRERAKAEERLKTLVKESELNMLKSQINPHFLFNSLNSVSSLILSNPEEAQEMILRLSDFVRYALKHRESEFVSLKEEIRRMEDYLAIEKVRFGDKLIYKLESAEKCESVEVPTMILQPLIENAIKHGVYESLDPVEVKFTCELENSSLRLKLVNDFDPTQPSRKGTGVGLQNVSERIRLVYDLKGSISWKTEKDQFIVNMIIPIEKH